MNNVKKKAAPKKLDVAFFFCCLKKNTNISIHAPAELLPETANRSVRLLVTKIIISQIFIFINTKNKALGQLPGAFIMLFCGGWGKLSGRRRACYKTDIARIITSCQYFFAKNNFLNPP
nr:MAG TPA: hypothetical protein [Caudoviricetes sp.]